MEFRYLQVFAALCLLSFNGCISYRSSFRKDPTSVRVVQSIIAEQETSLGRALIEERGAQGTLTLAALERISGPEQETVTYTENRWWRQWSPLLPLQGIVLLVMAPVGVFMPTHWDALYSGMDERNGCTKFSMSLRTGLYNLAGIGTEKSYGNFNCEVAMSRDRSATRDTGRKAEGRKPIANTLVRVEFLPKDSEGRLLDKKITIEGRTDTQGKLALALGDIFQDFQRAPHLVAVESRLAEHPDTSLYTEINRVQTRDLWRPVEESRVATAALRRAEAAERLNNGAASLRHYAAALSFTKDTRQRERLWEKIVSLSRGMTAEPETPEEAKVLLSKAEGLVELHDYSGARDALRNAIEQAPWLPSAHFNLALITAELGDFSGAAAEMRRYLSLVPDAANATEARAKMEIWEERR